MILSSLHLKNFRSYIKQSFQFSPVVTLIVGSNTTGKTNILEAIYSSTIGKSFRAEKESDMVRWGEQVSRITAQISNTKQYTNNKQEDTKLELIITTGEVNGEKAPTKKYLVNGVPRRLIDFVGNLNAVLFCPEDLEIVTDSPSLRRHYLNSVLVQTDREYRRNLQSFERGLRQRNRLLDFIFEGKAQRSQLVFWNQLLVKTGSYLTQQRQRYIDHVNTYQLSNLKYRIIYDKSVISETRLEQYKDEEVAAKSTLVGPQRDDIIFQKDQRSTTNDKKEGKWNDVSRFGSRGEQRLAVLWLKLAELNYIEAETEERPLLLLDDIFSELDEESRTIIFSIIGKQQTIITSAENDVVQLFKNIKDVKIVRLPVKNS